MTELPRVSAWLILYDGRLGGTPDTQGKLRYWTSPAVTATHVFADGLTILDTTTDLRDGAGFVADPALAPTLDRSTGYTLDFAVQVVAEEHAGSDKNADGVGDRAGFSVLVLGSDAHGIELGFWTDQIWAQEAGTAEPPAGTLFTHAESAAYDTTRGLTAYRLEIQADAYRLASNGTVILSGAVRDYTAFEGPVNPYRTPNFIFLGDNTTSAQARIKLAYVAVHPSRATV